MSLHARVMALSHLRADYAHISKELGTLSSRIRTHGVVSVAEVSRVGSGSDRNNEDDEELHGAAWQQRREKLDLLKGVQAKILFRKVPIALSRIERLLRPKGSGGGSEGVAMRYPSKNKGGEPPSKRQLKRMKNQRIAARRRVNERGIVAAESSSLAASKPTPSEIQTNRQAAADAFLSVGGDGAGSQATSSSSTPTTTAPPPNRASSSSSAAAAGAVLTILDSLSFFEKHRQLFLEKEMSEYRLKCRELSGIYRSKTKKLRLSAKGGQSSSSSSARSKGGVDRQGGGDGDGVPIREVEIKLVHLANNRISPLRVSILARPYTSALMWVSTLKFPILGTNKEKKKEGGGGGGGVRSPAPPPVSLRVPYVASLVSMVDSAFRAAHNQHSLFSNDGIPDDVAKNVPRLLDYKTHLKATTSKDAVVNSQSPRFVATPATSGDTTGDGSKRQQGPSWMPSPAHGVTELVLKSFLRIALVLNSLCTPSAATSMPVFVTGLTLSTGDICNFTKTLCTLQKLAQSFLGSVQRTEADIAAAQSTLIRLISEITKVEEQKDEAIALLPLPREDTPVLERDEDGAKAIPNAPLADEVDPFAALGLNLDNVLKTGSAITTATTPEDAVALQEEKIEQLSQHYESLQRRATDTYMSIQAKEMGVRGVHNILLKLEGSITQFVSATVHYLGEQKPDSIAHLKTIQGAELLANLWSLQGLHTMKPGTPLPTPDEPIDTSHMKMTPAQEEVFIALISRTFPQVNTNTAAYLIAAGNSNSLDSYTTKKWRRKVGGLGVRSVKDVKDVLGELSAAKIEARLSRRRIEAALRASRVEGIGKRHTEEMGMYIPFAAQLNILRCLSAVSMYTLDGHSSPKLVERQKSINTCLRQMVEAMFVRLLISGADNNKSEDRSAVLSLLALSCSSQHSKFMGPIVKDAMRAIRSKKETSNATYLFLQYLVKQLKGSLSARLHHLLASDEERAAAQAEEQHQMNPQKSTLAKDTHRDHPSAKLPLSLVELSKLIPVLCKLSGALPSSDKINEDVQECLMLCKVFLVDEDAVQKELMQTSNEGSAKRDALETIMTALQEVDRLDTETHDLLLDARRV